MTMLETKTALEDALYNNSRLSYDTMINSYIAVCNYLAGCGNNDVKFEIDLSKVKVN